MPETIDIAAVWDRLNDTFVEIYSEVIRNTATVKWRAAAYDNPYFYIRAYAEFDRAGRPEEEDLVIGVDIVKQDGLVVWETDACQMAGHVLADGPTHSAAESEPLSSWLGTALDDAVAWFRAETPNFVAYLNREPTPYDVD